MEEKKTHYRKVFKSDHLGVADLEEFIEEGKRLVFTIKEVKQEYDIMVAGRKGNHNIAYFKEKVKPLVLNAGNSKIVKTFNNGSSFVEDWSNTVVELYIDSMVKFGSDTVSGVRIKPVQPKMKKPELTPDNKNWSKAKAAVKMANATRESIEKNWIITDQNYEQLCS